MTLRLGIRAITQTIFVTYSGSYPFDGPKVLPRWRELLSNSGANAPIKLSPGF